VSDVGVTVMARQCKYKVQAVNPSTGAEADLVVSAVSEEDAVRCANDMGLMAGRVELVGGEPTIQPQSIGPLLEPRSKPASDGFAFATQSHTLPQHASRVTFASFWPGRARKWSVACALILVIVVVACAAAPMGGIKGNAFVTFGSGSSEVLRGLEIAVVKRADAVALSEAIAARANMVRTRVHEDRARTPRLACGDGISRSTKKSGT